MADFRNGQQLGILGADGQPYRRSLVNGDIRANADAYRENPPQFWLPAQVASASIFGGPSRTYWHDRFDEALRHSKEDAHAFKRDARIKALLNERKRSVMHLKWHIDVPDVNDPDQKLVRDVVTRAIESIHDFQDVKSCLLEALWYGKYAVQWIWGKRYFKGVKTKVPLRWEPLHGDKIGYQWQDDGAPDIPYVLVHGGSVGFLKERGGKVVPTTMGLGLLLEKHWRGRFTIHHHEIEDWDFWEADQALMKHGVGLRSHVYWTEYLRKEIESWITDFMERVGLGVTMWKYEAGNSSALTEVQAAAKAYDRRVNVFVPCWPDGTGKMIGGVERVDPPLAGAEFLRTLIEYFDRQVERLFIGQEGSAKGMSAGLGNEATADFMQSCVPTDSEILTRNGFKSPYDARIGEEVLAYDVETDTCRWTPLLNKTFYSDRPICRMFQKNNRFEAFCTADHSWAIERTMWASEASGRPERYSILPEFGDSGGRGAALLKKQRRQLIEAQLIRARANVILAAAETETEGSLLTPVESAILGWIVTDGSVLKTLKGTRKSTITQSKEKNFDGIRRLIGIISPGAWEYIGKPTVRTFPSGHTYACKPQHIFGIHCEPTERLLGKCGFRSRADLPRIVTRLNRAARQSMLEAMMLAEGTGRTFHNGDPCIMEAFEILCALEGKACGRKAPSETIFKKAIKSNRYAYGAYIQIENAGRCDIWCPTTKYGTWVMRQRGRVMITGNTKDQITKEDANRFGEGLTGNEWSPSLVNQIVRWTEWPNPKMNQLPARMLFGIESTASEKKAAGLRTLFDMGIPFKASDARDAVGIVAPTSGDEICENVELKAAAQQAKMQNEQAQAGGAPGEEEQPQQLGSFLEGLRGKEQAGSDSGTAQNEESQKSQESAGGDEEDTTAFSREGEPFLYELSGDQPVSHWVEDPPKHFRQSTATAKNKRWRNTTTGAQVYYPTDHNPNEHGEKQPKSEKGQGLRLEQAKPKDPDVQAGQQAFQKLAGLDAVKVSPQDVQAFAGELAKMKPGALKAMTEHLTKAGIDLSSSASDRGRLSNHIVDAVLERTKKLPKSSQQDVAKTKEKLAKKGLAAPPVDAKSDPETMRSYFVENFDKVLGSQSDDQLRADLKQIGVPLPENASRDTMKHATADYMASRAALRGMFALGAGMAGGGEAAAKPETAKTPAVPVAVQPPEKEVETPAKGVPSVPLSDAEWDALTPEQMQAELKRLADNPPAVPDRGPIGQVPYEWSPEQLAAQAARDAQLPQESQSQSQAEHDKQMREWNAKNNDWLLNLPQGLTNEQATKWFQENQPSHHRERFGPIAPHVPNEGHEASGVPTKADVEAGGRAKTPAPAEPAKPSLKERLLAKGREGAAKQAPAEPVAPVAPQVQAPVEKPKLTPEQRQQKKARLAQRHAEQQREQAKIRQEKIAAGQKRRSPQEAFADLEGKKEPGNIKRFKGSRAEVSRQAHAPSVAVSELPEAEQAQWKQLHAEAQAKFARESEGLSTPADVAFEKERRAKGWLSPTDYANAKFAELQKAKGATHATPEVGVEGRVQAERERNDPQLASEEAGARGQLQNEATSGGAEGQAQERVATPEEHELMDTGSPEGEVDTDFGYGANAPTHMPSAAHETKAQGLVAADLQSLPGAEGSNPRRKAHVDRILKNPQSAEILGQIPKGSKFIGSGREAMTFRTPQGDVVRVGDLKERPNIPEVLQPTKTTHYGDVTVEHLPLATFPNNDPNDLSAETQDAADELKAKLAERGYTHADFGPGTIGKVNGEWKVLDPGGMKKVGADEEPVGQRNLLGEVEQPKKQGLFNEPVRPDKKPRDVDKNGSLAALSAVQKRDLKSWDMPQPLRGDSNNFRTVHIPTGNSIESDSFGQYIVRDKAGNKIGKPFATAEEAAKFVELTAQQRGESTHYARKQIGVRKKINRDKNTGFILDIIEIPYYEDEA